MKITKYRKGKKLKLKQLFGKYFLPFSLNEKILLFVFLLVFSTYLFSVVLSENYSLLFIFPIFVFILFYSFYSRIFKRIETIFGKKENISIIEGILNRQEIVSNSLDQKGLFLFDLKSKKGIETMVVLCEDNNIYINSYFHRMFFSFKRKNLNQLEKLINIHIAKAQKTLKAN